MEDTQPKLRSSCDACAGAKVKCTKEHPRCSRCISLNIKCVYGISMKHGKPRRRQIIGSTMPSSDSSSHRPTPEPRFSPHVTAFSQSPGMLKRDIRTAFDGASPHVGPTNMYDSMQLQNMDIPWTSGLQDMPSDPESLYPTFSASTTDSSGSSVGIKDFYSIKSASTGFPTPTGEYNNPFDTLNQDAGQPTAFYSSAPPRMDSPAAFDSSVYVSPYAADPHQNISQHGDCSYAHRSPNQQNCHSTYLSLLVTLNSLNRRVHNNSAHSISAFNIANLSITDPTGLNLSHSDQTTLPSILQTTQSCLETLTKRLECPCAIDPATLMLQSTLILEILKLHSATSATNPSPQKSHNGLLSPGHHPHSPNNATARLIQSLKSVARTVSKIDQAGDAEEEEDLRQECVRAMKKTLGNAVRKVQNGA